MLILAFIALLISIVGGSNKPSSFAPCGLTGFVPKYGQKIDLSKLFLFALANEERGTDSCGIGVGNMYWERGVDKLSKARDFLFTIKEDLEALDLRNQPVIFHTRKSTRGIHTKNNAHPMKYVWGKEGNKKSMMLAHNGSVTNDYKIFTDFVKPYSPEVKFTDYIDTRVFAHAFATAMSHNEFNRIFEILKMYEGAAAFLFYTNSHFYVWKGAAGDTLERPMYYIETEEGWYFHSIPTVLALASNMEAVKEVGNNTLMSFNQSGIVDSLVIPRANYSSYDYSIPATKIETFGVVKMNVHGLYVQNGQIVDRYIASYGNFCKGLATYKADINTENTVKALLKCQSKKEFEETLEKTKLEGVSLKIPIIHNHKVIALWDSVKKGYLEDNTIFKDSRTSREYIYKNQTITEYVNHSTHSKK